MEDSAALLEEIDDDEPIDVAHLAEVQKQIDSMRIQAGRCLFDIISVFFLTMDQALQTR